MLFIFIMLMIITVGPFFTISRPYHDRTWQIPAEKPEKRELTNPLDARPPGKIAPQRAFRQQVGEKGRHARLHRAKAGQ